MSGPTGTTSALPATEAGYWTTRGGPWQRAAARPRREREAPTGLPPMPFAEAVAAAGTAFPFDHLGRTAWQVLELRRQGTDPGVSLCPNPACNDRMTARQGDDIATHFAHVCGPGETKTCSEQSESYWHRAVKLAAVFYADEGWQAEQAYTAGGKEYRADLLNRTAGRHLEAVHTLSATYRRKHLDTSAEGTAPTWLFDTAASFALADLEGDYLGRFDRKEAIAGRLVARRLFNKSARDLIAAIGIEHCFAYFCGFVFSCRQIDNDCDCWAAVPAEHWLNNIVRGKDRLNNLLIERRVSGADGGRQLAIGLSTNWSPDPRDLIDRIRIHHLPPPPPPPLRPGVRVPVMPGSGEEMFKRHRAKQCPWGEHVWVETEREARPNGYWVKAECERCGKFYGWRPENVPGFARPMGTDPSE